MNTPEEVLDGAREIIERDGWHQGGLYEGRSTDLPSRYHEADRVAARTAPVCAMGALYRALYGTVLSSEFTVTQKTNTLFGQALTLLKRQVKLIEQHSVVPAWNDDPARSKEDVILAFKQAAHGG